MATTLVLHFDVNKTMIMMDPVQGKDVEHVLNDILTENILGTIEKGKWHWNGEEVQGGEVHDDGTPPSISFSQYLRTIYPNNGTFEERKKNKKIRKEKRGTFTSDNQPGVGLRSQYTQLQDKLRLPSYLIGTPAATDIGLTTAYHFILPSFFALLVNLQKRGRTFHLILRTFGQDIEAVAVEFNAFCTGNHPLFPHVHMDGKEGSIDMRLCLESNICNAFGTVFRNESQVSIVWGTLLQPPLDTTNLLSFYDKNVYEIISGYKEIHENIKNRLTKRASLALRDYYPYWWKKQQCCTAGKLMTVEKENSLIHTVFFDDNILPHDSHIVDAVNGNTGASLEYKETKDIHLLGVESIRAINEKSYFIDLLQKAEDLYQLRNNKQ